MEYIVGSVSEVPEGTTVVVYPEKVKSGIGVFNIDGEYYALKNTCPHMGGPLCKGRVRGTTDSSTDGEKIELHWVRSGEVIACPWHHWEFDIKTGKTLFASRQKVRRYEVTVEPPEVMERLKAGVETVPVTVEDSMIVLHI